MLAICRAAVFCGVVFACGGAFAQTGADHARGAVKTAACDDCHGSPERPPTDSVPLLAGQPHEFLVLQMFYMREGLREVPQKAGIFNGYSDRDLEDVAAHYARQTSPRGNGNPKPALHVLGANLSRAMGCGSCHLPDYRGQKHVPRLSNQREDYLTATLKAYRDNKRTGTDTSMNGVMYQVTDSEIRALAHYLAHQ
jgi:cytochrome c553